MTIFDRTFKQFHEQRREAVKKADEEAKAKKAEIPPEASLPDGSFTILKAEDLPEVLKAFEYVRKQHFAGGFDGCVAHMQSEKGGGHDEASATRICGYINAHVRGGGPVYAHKIEKHIIARTTALKAELPKDFEPTSFSRILKFNPHHDQRGRFATGDAAQAVTGPRSGESNSGQAGATTAAPTPDAGGPRSGENKGTSANRGEGDAASRAAAPSGDVSGPRSSTSGGDQAGAHTSAQAEVHSAASAVSGPRSGESNSGQAGASAAAPTPTAGGPRSGENKATDGSNAGGGAHGLADGPTSGGETARIAAPTGVFTNDLKRGTRVRLRNGWEARIEDNKKGNTRLATVYGYATEMGSVYSHDITHARDASGKWQPVSHTDQQRKLKQRVRQLGF